MLLKMRVSVFYKFSRFSKWWLFKLEFKRGNRKRSGSNRSGLHVFEVVIRCCVLSGTESLWRNQLSTNFCYLKFFRFDLMHNWFCKSHRPCNHLYTQLALRSANLFNFIHLVWSLKTWQTSVLLFVIDILSSV